MTATTSTILIDDDSQGDGRVMAFPSTGDDELFDVFLLEFLQHEFGKQITDF